MTQVVFGQECVQNFGHSCLNKCKDHGEKWILFLAFFVVYLHVVQFIVGSEIVFIVSNPEVGNIQENPTAVPIAIFYLHMHTTNVLVGVYAFMLKFAKTIYKYANGEYQYIKLKLVGFFKV